MMKALHNKGPVCPNRQLSHAKCPVMGSVRLTHSFRRNPKFLVHATPPSSTDSRETGKVQEGERYDPDQRRAMEDELRDPRNFVEYLLPRPIRITLFYFTSVASLLATVLNGAALIRDGDAGSVAIGSVALNAGFCVLFAILGNREQQAGEERVIQRKVIRDAQIRLGDREVFVNESGEKMSRLKPVNAEWILRRLERWGKRDSMPFVGPQKAPILAELVTDKKPKLAVEVGTMAAYSALVIAQALPEGSKLVSLEKDWLWWLVANRYLSMASSTPGISEKVDVWLGDAVEKLPKIGTSSQAQKIDLLFLDGVPKEYLSYLKAAEANLAPGAVVIADNAGVFKDGGMKGYLEYVRTSPNYSSRFIESTLEWRDDVPDGLEVSVYQPLSE